MLSSIKKLLYFPLAHYFKFFAGIRLMRWNPRIILVTGSNGKTTLLHMLESQIGNKAKYSHYANSSYGIPFNILGLRRQTLLKTEWINLFLKAPFAAFKNPPIENIYVVEADCDRPGEGKFLASFLKPSIVIWLSLAKTHSMNFEHAAKERHFSTVEEAIAYEFGYFIEYSKDVVLVNGDEKLIDKQLKRTKAKVISVKKENTLKKYEVGETGTLFSVGNEKFKFNYLLPEEVFYSIEMSKKLCDILNITFDQSFFSFKMPPGRGSIFSGIKEITIVDSSYNANLSSMKAIISVFSKFKAENKWVVLGDMLEQGESEKEEHEKLAKIIAGNEFERVILMGPRVSEYTYPKLNELVNVKAKVVKFMGPRETLDYILKNIKGEEVILFKGARFMEGIIEHLLENKSDIEKLSRREKIWEIRRKQWGL